MIQNDMFIQAYMDIKKAIEKNDLSLIDSAITILNSIELDEQEKHMLEEAIYIHSDNIDITEKIALKAQSLSDSNIRLEQKKLTYELKNKELTKEKLLDKIANIDKLFGSEFHYRNYILGLIQACEVIGNIDEMDILRKKLISIGIIN